MQTLLKFGKYPERYKYSSKRYKGAVFTLVKYDNTTAYLSTDDDTTLQKISDGLIPIPFYVFKMRFNRIRFSFIKRILNMPKQMKQRSN
jgi:hypothetical protein